MRNSSLVERSGAENNRALSLTPKLRIADVVCSGRGAFQRHRSRVVKRGGVSGKENVGMSNDKTSEKLVRRKPKSSCSTLIGTGLVGT